MKSARLIRKELGSYIGTKIRAANTPPMSKGFEDKVHKLSNLAKKFVVNTVVLTEIPPCIEHAIESLNKGENLSHSGRFYASYISSWKRTDNRRDCLHYSKMLLTIMKKLHGTKSNRLQVKQVEIEQNMPVRHAKRSKVMICVLLHLIVIIL